MSRRQPSRRKPLRIAYLVYRGNPHCGGQGVYTRALAKELTELGHEITVFSGPPYPDLVHPEQLEAVPGLDLYRANNPFRVPWPHEFRDRIDLSEFAIMCAAGYPEPLAFSLRIRRLLQHRRGEFDLVHDNQCLGRGLVPMIEEDGWPVLATLHHPITVDRDLDVAHAPNAFRRFSIRRWYSFLDMQMEVARRMPRVLTVSESSRGDIVEQMGVSADRLHIVPVGMDPEIFGPRPAIARVPGRLMTTASADVPMKGLAPLLESLAKVRAERNDAHLVVIGKPKGKSKIPALIERLGLTDAVEFVSGVTTERIVELYAQAEVACVPSLYEGFSLPAVEAMACGVPVVGTTGGAVPEVIGRDGETGLLVPPGDPDAFAVALLRALGDPELRARIGAAGRERAIARVTWRRTAEGTAEHYHAMLDEHPKAGGR
ncbi:MAG: glycosyltransferase family 4 protein [Acidimicrobiia bacterium]|nr:glycosyltransferase family 4 protein [Acidimicrobiia bacterium]